MATIEQPTTIEVKQVTITLNDETVQLQNVDVTETVEFAADAHICDDECYDCLDCDYEHFDQWSEHPGTPALSHSPAATPAEQPSTPFFMPAAEPLHSEHLSLGERLLSWGTHGLQALGSSALHALLPSDEDEDVGLRLSPRLSAADKIKSAGPAFSPAPAILLEPARPGAHVRFLVRQPRVSKMIPTPSIAAFGSSIFIDDEESDEELEMFEEGVSI
ncbi:hypothetical protein CC85DRAFT_289699 [Cutaneotrichosporon oleaginosum]|uniref:Uncharacterized protein n=1 Tax=Cutaneotrichosporon oleaginosum TaxID=879819 RepID=A0A0J0XZ82_9TREE|nr:uncharacterized protein CC85DRAFT_289699 [Cutaneotrichosporon oleaginosum]KLT46351.1 hypothetical protein CC85DRAFT_289699 [Cutaneotrichosporon oleaginosum]